MRCVHGFEENECPTCRIDKLSLPPISAKLIKDNKNDLKAENPYFKKHLSLKDEFVNDLMNSHKFKQPIFSKLLPKLNTLNLTPSFKESLFTKELEKHSLNQLDTFNILKKVELKKPELDIQSKD